jgi:hypothetical protein
MPIIFPKNNKRDDAEDFISLKDGQSVSGIIRGNPLTFYQHWLTQGETRAAVACPGKSACPHCAQGVKSGFRSRFNFIIKDNGEYVPKILEQGAKVYEVIEELQTTHGYDLERTVLRVARKGSGFNDTTYSVVPVQGQTVDDVLNKKLSGIKLLDLNPHKATEDKTSDADEFVGADLHESDIPF